MKSKLRGTSTGKCVPFVLSGFAFTSGMEPAGVLEVNGKQEQTYTADGWVGADGIERM